MGSSCLFSLSLPFTLIVDSNSALCDVAGPRQNLQTGDIPSLVYLPLFLSSHTLPGQSMAVLFYSILGPEVCCGSGELMTVCYGLRASTFEKVLGRS